MIAGISEAVSLGTLGVIGSVVTAVGSIVAAKQARDARREVSTGNGKSAGEYLTTLGSRTEEAIRVIATHTVQDDIRFAEQGARLESLERSSNDIISLLRSLKASLEGRIEDVEEAVTVPDADGS